MQISDAYRNSTTSCTRGHRHGNPPSSGRGLHRPGKASLRILQINVEGWTAAKSEILQQLADKHLANVVLVQETHQTSQEKLKLYGFLLADYIASAHHGIATFIKNDLSFTHIDNSDEGNATEWIAVKIADTIVVNVYHPPPATLDISSFPATSEQFIFAGDLNCRHENWGYPNANVNGENLATWANLNNLLTLFDPKQPASFHSGRWNSGTNPDIAFCTKIFGITPERTVLGRFPRSQHRPSLITTPPLVSLTSSAPVHRWNFRKADWDRFTEKLDVAIHDLPLPKKNTINEDYHCFIRVLKSVAKECIPRGFRKSYIPTWDSECTDLYQLYEESTDPDEISDAATNLLEKLDEKRQARWKESVAEIDFTHSSRKAWNAINRLTGRNIVKKNCPVNPNAIAKQLVTNGTYLGADKSFQRNVKRQVSALRSRKLLPDDEHLSSEFTISEVEVACQFLKLRKAPGPDGIHNEFLTHMGPKFLAWITALFNVCFNTGRIPKMWRRATVIAVLKPGKEENNPSSYRPISLLCSIYKLFERIILSRINPIVERSLPPEQAGFRRGRSTLDQVAQLTDKIEESFDLGQVSGAVFLDLTSAYDTVWLQGLHLKLQRTISCSKITDLIMNLLYNRSFVLFAGGQSSRPFRLKNGVAQGSVLAPTLYNIYTADFPDTASRRYMYADDVALTCSDKSISVVEDILSSDMERVSEYYHKWHLKLSTNKTVSSIFHLRNRLANYAPKVLLNNKTLPFDSRPKYLGITLDRSLTYREQLEKLKNKMTSRVALVKRLAGTTWGASFDVLRNATLALVVSPAEYCAPIWHESTHVQKLDIPFNEAMRTISGCIRCTRVSFLPVIAGIEPLEHRRLKVLGKLVNGAVHPVHPLHRMLHCSPNLTRLRSRRPLRNLARNIPESVLTVPEGLSIFIPKWTNQPPGHRLTRHQWVQLNRLRCGAGKFAANMFRWGFRSSPSCPCGADLQSHLHVMTECPLLKPPCSLNDLNDPRLLSFLDQCKF